MVTISKLQAGQYLVSDGRFIVKDGSKWYVLNKNRSHDFGPLTTLKAAKEYVQSGTAPIGQHNLSTNYGRRQSKKEFYAYLAAEANNGNYLPAILWMLAVGAVCLFFYLVRGY